MSKALGLDQSSNMKRILLQTQTISERVSLRGDLPEVTTQSENTPE